MTRRDGDATIKMTKMDQQEPGRGKYSLGPESRSDTSPQPAPLSSGSKHRHDRDSLRSTSNSLPGSRASSRPGSRMASRTNSQESIIDLFDGMTLAYGLNGNEGKGFQLISPKPRDLPHQRWTWTDKLRINSAIWRAWHIQFVKGKKPIGCHFEPRLPESRPTLQADAIQSGRGTTGSIQYNQSQVGSVVRDYRRWRLYHMDTGKPGTTPTPQGEPVENPEEKAFNLDSRHPPLSPMAARTLLNDDLSKDFYDTLFISKRKYFSVPHPKKIARHVYNADILQPGLMQLEPDFNDDFMDTLDSLQDTFCKTPTKVDLRSLIEFNDGLLNTDSMNAFSDSFFGSLTTVSEETNEAQQDPILMAASMSPFPVAITPNPASVARNLTYQSFPVAPSSSSSAPGTSAPLWGQSGYQAAAGKQSQSFSKQSPGVSPSSVVYTSGASFSQMPPILEVSAGGAGGGGMTMMVDSVPYPKSQISSTASTLSQVYSSGVAKQEPYSPPMAASPQTMNPGVDINDALDIIAAQLQQQQQQQQLQQLQRQQQQQQYKQLQQQAQNASAVSMSQTSWSDSNQKGKSQPGASTYTMPMVSTNWPNSNLPQALPSSGMNWSSAGGVSDVSLTMGGFPQGIMSQGGLSSSNLAFIQNAGGLPHGMIADTMAPMDQNILLGAAYSQQNKPVQSSTHHTPGHGTPGHTMPGHTNAGHRTPGHQTPGHLTPGHVTPGHVTPGHGTPGHGTPGYATPGHATPGHTTPGHSTPGHTTPGHTTPGHTTPGHTTPGHTTPGHVTPGHVTPGHVTPGPSTPRMDESMEFEEFPFPSTPKSSSSTSSSYKTKRDRPRSRKNSHDRSPRVSQVGFTDAATYAAYMGKSEAKDLGMPSPSEMSVIPFLPSTGHRSNVSSAASSPGSVTEGTEFEFPTPQPKRRKTPDGSGEKESRRRYKHLQSEHKRRFNIQSGLDEIQRVVPSLRNTNDANKSSTATMLQKAHEHIVMLKAESKDMRNDAEKLREEIQALNTEIDSCQDELPDSGAPVAAQSDRQLYQMMDAYTHQRMKDNWTFWIFSLIVRPLFETYLSAVSSSHVSDFDQTVQDWTEEHCRLKPLRKLVTAALTRVSRQTSILMDPASLPTQIKEIIAKDNQGPQGAT